MEQSSSVRIAWMVLRVTGAAIAVLMILIDKGIQTSVRQGVTPSDDLIVGVACKLTGLMLILLLFFAWRRTAVVRAGFRSPEEARKHRLALAGFQSLLAFVGLVLTPSIAFFSGPLGDDTISRAASEIVGRYLLGGIIAGIPSLVSAIGLFSNRAWARKALIVAGFTGAQGSIIGNLLGLYGWWYWKKSGGPPQLQVGGT